MVFTVYIYATLKKSLKNFMQIKGVTQREIIKNVAAAPLEYEERFYYPQKKDKEKMSLVCDENDLTKLRSLWVNNRFESKYINGEKCRVEINFSTYISNLMYNYMMSHKDDTPRVKKAKGRGLTIYLTTDQWELLNEMSGDMKPAEYIKEVVFK